MKFTVMFVAGALVAGVSSFGASAAENGNAEQLCAAAAANAQAQGLATDSELATCSLAIKLASGGASEAELLAHMRASSALIMPASVWDRVAASYVNRGLLHFARSEFTDAVADSTAALALDGHSPEAMMNRGAALLQMHRPADAAADFTRALQLAPAHLERVYFDRAMAREDMGDIRGAYADYRQASQLAPEWAEAKQELARFRVVPAKPMS